MEEWNYDHYKGYHYWRHSAPIFMSIGMHCLGCPASQGETVAKACAVHGVDVEALLAKVNELIAAGK